MHLSTKICKYCGKFGIEKLNGTNIIVPNFGKMYKSNPNLSTINLCKITMIIILQNHTKYTQDAYQSHLQQDF